MYVHIFGYLVNKLEIWWVYLSPIESSKVKILKGRPFECKNSLKCPLFYSLWVEMLKNGPFQNLTQVVGSILVTSVTPPPPL